MNIFKHNNKTGGFSLVELMVVITIIGILSSVAIASLNSSRIKARDANRLSLVKQYANALELYRGANTAYPVAEDYTCLGVATGDTCYGSAWEGSDDLNAALNPYIQGTPAMNDPVLVSGTDLKGLLYKCATDGSCAEGYELLWYMETDTDNCAGGDIVSSGEQTLCAYPFDHS